MKYIETRTISKLALYRLCNENDWYTCGTSAEYELMFKKAHGNMTTEKMVALAEDIVEHSAPKCFTDCEANGITPMEHVLFELCEISHSLFEMAETAEQDE